MRKFLLFCACLLLVSCSTKIISGKQFFINIPDYVTTEEAFYDLRHAAIKRKWTILEAKKNKLHISLDHKEYKAQLELFISSGKIEYTDSTKAFTVMKRWISYPAPKSWVENLKSDTSNFFYVRFKNKKANPPKDQAEKRLER